MQQPLRFYTGFFVLLSWLLASCSVYAPLQPGAPVIRQKGEAEVVASAYLNGRLEASASYSPVEHVIVRAAGGLRAGGGDSTYFRNRQMELGLGTYRYLNEQWLVGGLIGYGFGRSNRRFSRDGFETLWLDSVVTYEYAARYHKLFADAYVANDAGRVTYGGAFRLSQVRFTSLTDKGLPLPLQRMTRAEPMLFMRFSGRNSFRWLQLQLASSLSWSPDERKHSSSDIRVRDTKEARLFTSFGLVAYPHLFNEK
ncbi:hypothetical protein [Hymenobacter fodinae]|uniref:DUF481 domain-containing protein n=1 Tax=Hymenobacter fodinae TaxID=2510796 RepID=A0A4Z0P5V6_9BACT|nr:hypothetical protein [Hymenobacter fodinae]TGE07782.1 hypothetical protein EU556_08485 [Hymenobacter fodinae]